MTMVPLLRCPFATFALLRSWVACCWLAATLMLFCTPELLLGQTPDVHYQHRGDMPPGAIGMWQLQRGGPLRGYFQPVEIKVPPGAEISLAEGEPHPPDGAESLLAGMLIGQVYRARVTRIPLHLGEEVFPSVELIDRLYPPPHLAARFPIPIEITQDDLEAALDGKFVVRVVYVEDPQFALPVRGQPGRPSWFDVEPGEDPLHTADALGRPVAIVRMGGRVPLEPGEFGGSGEFCPPPVFRFSRAAAETVSDSAGAVDRSSTNTLRFADGKGGRPAEPDGHE